MGGQRLWLGKIRPRLSYGKYELLDMETATKDGAHITIKFKNKEDSLVAFTTGKERPVTETEVKTFFR